MKKLFKLLIIPLILLVSGCIKNNSIEKTSSIDTDISADVVEDTLNDITKNKIELDDNSKSQIAKDYLDTIYNSIPEEAVTQKPNVVVTID